MFKSNSWSACTTFQCIANVYVALYLGHLVIMIWLYLLLKVYCTACYNYETALTVERCRLTSYY